MREEGRGEGKRERERCVEKRGKSEDPLPHSPTSLIVSEALMNLEWFSYTRYCILLSNSCISEDGGKDTMTIRTMLEMCTISSPNHSCLGKSQASFPGLAGGSLGTRLEGFNMKLQV